jgi:2'-5' RNA ligase
MVAFAIYLLVIRAFIAIDVPEFKIILKFEDELAKLGKMKIVEPENLHFTLKFLGDIEEDLSEEIKTIIESFKYRTFQVTLRGCGAFPNMSYIKIVWIGADEGPIREMSEQIDEKLRALAFKAEKDHVPHLTVARVKSKIVDMSIFEKYKNTEFGTFKVEYIKLKKSTLTEEGPIYEDIATIKLLE